MKEYIKPPVKIDETVEITIEEIGKKGDGFGRINGYVIFVPDTKKGMMYSVKITKVTDRFGFGIKDQEEQ